MVPKAVTKCARNDLEKVETNALALYDTLPLLRKSVLIFFASWSTLRAYSSSTSLLSASNEIAQGFGTTLNTIDLYTGSLLFAKFCVDPGNCSCCMFSLFLFSSLIYRCILKFSRPSDAAQQTTFYITLLLNIGVALARNMPTFFALRVLSGL